MRDSVYRLGMLQVIEAVLQALKEASQDEPELNPLCSGIGNEQSSLRPYDLVETAQYEGHIPNEEVESQKCDGANATLSSDTLPDATGYSIASEESERYESQEELEYLYPDALEEVPSSHLSKEES